MYYQILFYFCLLVNKILFINIIYLLWFLMPLTQLALVLLQEVHQHLLYHLESSI